MDDRQRFLIVFGAAIGGAAIAILIALILDAPEAGWVAIFGAPASAWIARRLVQER